VDQPYGYDLTCYAEGTVADCSGDGGCSPASYLGDGWCDGVDQPYGYDLTCYAEGTVADCSGDGGCSPASYLGDGWCDGVDQPYGYDLTCYAEGTVADCSGDGGCSPASYLGDGWCDGVDQPYGYDLTCYAEESTTDCAVAPAVGASCGDGSSLYDCMLQCVPAGLVYSYDGDGWCDDGAYGLYLNCPEFDNDSGDCGAATGGTDDSCVYSNDGWCDEPMWCATGTDCTDCGTCTGARAQAQDPEQCVEGYCPEGTYFDGYSCYDCDYCLNYNDDSACSAESGLDCAGACGDLAAGCSDSEFDCGDAGSYYYYYYGDSCIPNSYECDGWADCYDGSDEANCGGSEPTECADGEYDCGEAGGWLGQCIASSWLCDGYNDCNDGSDEADCGGDDPGPDPDWVIGGYCLLEYMDYFTGEFISTEGIIGCNNGCVSAETAISWTGDGACDDPWMGFYLNCEEFCFDGGDCADSVPADFDVAACMEEFNSSIQAATSKSAGTESAQSPPSKQNSSQFR
jgi:hypothetical protein